MAKKPNPVKTYDPFSVSESKKTTSSGHPKIRVTCGFCRTKSEIRMPSTDDPVAKCDCGARNHIPKKFCRS